MRLMIAAALLAAAGPALAQSTPAQSAPAQTAPAQTAPVEHRLTPDEIAAAQADGETRNRAAELLAMTRGDPSLALPAEKPKKWHGTAEVGIGTNGYREIAGEISTQFGQSGTATIAGAYGAYNTPFRTRVPNR